MVVVPAGVSATDFGAAARVYWTLKVAGHPAVSILDGGFAAWQAAAYPVESGKSAPSPKIFTAKLDERLLAEVEAVERNEHATLVDARPASYFEGKEKAPAAKAYGHIPGAINLDSATLLRSRDQPAAAEGAACAIAASLPPGRWWPIATPGTGRRRTGSCCRPCWAGRTCGCTTARWSNGPPIRTVRSRARARGSTI